MENKLELEVGCYAMGTYPFHDMVGVVRAIDGRKVSIWFAGIGVVDYDRNEIKVVGEDEWLKYNGAYIEPPIPPMATRPIDMEELKRLGEVFERQKRFLKGLGAGDCNGQ